MGDPARGSRSKVRGQGFGRAVQRREDSGDELAARSGASVRWMVVRAEAVDVPRRSTGITGAGDEPDVGDAVLRRAVLAETRDDTGGFGATHRPRRFFPGGRRRLPRRAVPGVDARQRRELGAERPGPVSYTHL